MASRRRSSVIATIVIPDSLLRAASVSGPAASISNHNSSAGISSRQNTLDAIPDEPEGLPTDRSRSIVIIEPQPARLEDTRQASYTSAGEITLMDTNHVNLSPCSPPVSVIEGLLTATGYFSFLYQLLDE